MAEIEAIEDDIHPVSDRRYAAGYADGLLAGKREALEEAAKVAERSLIGHTLTPGGMARQDEAESIAADIRALKTPSPLIADKPINE